jgi:hypothetical protein
MKGSTIRATFGRITIMTARRPSLGIRAALLFLSLDGACGISKPNPTDGNPTGGSAGGGGGGGGGMGGTSSGGSSLGGSSLGGSSVGGSSVGGSSVGGSSIGGNSVGGSSIGGGSLGGNSTGGSAVGGSAGGGNGGSGGAAVAVNLRTAGNFVILAKSGISSVPDSIITGNLGVSPAGSTSITGFSLTADSTNVFSTSAQVTGRVYAANHAVPTPSDLTAAVGDMELAYTDAASRAPDVIELGGGSIGGMTLIPGVYKWGSGVLISSNLTLTGGATAVWVFEIAQSLTLGNATRISLTGGAMPRNVFWQVAGGVVLGTTAHLEGVVLGHTAITMATGASINGRLLAQTAVTLDRSTVAQPGP